MTTTDAPLSSKDDTYEALLEALNRLIEPEAREIERLRAENDKLLTDFLRYRQALYRANGFLIMHKLEPVKLEYPTDTSTSDQTVTSTNGTPPVETPGG